MRQGSLPVKQGWAMATLEATVSEELGYIVEVNLTQREFDRLNEIREIAGVGSNEQFLKLLIEEYRSRVLAW
jgi:hypothetical protein